MRLTKFWVGGLVIALLVTGLTITTAPSASAQAPRQVLSCWATKIGSDQVRVTWTPDPADISYRYVVYGSRNNGPYYWKARISQQGPNQLTVTESNAGMRYRVESVAPSNARVSKDCGPFNDDAAPKPVVSCWAVKQNDGTFRVTWTARPDDNAVRYAVRSQRNSGDFRWAANTSEPNSRAIRVDIFRQGQYRFRVRTIARNNAFTETDCGPGTAIGRGLRVMTVGDSITLGAIDRPAYRYPMQGDSRYAACRIYLVGSFGRAWADGPPTAPFANANHNHVSRGGNTVADLQADVRQQVAVHQPDVVLIHLGTNDVQKNRNLVDSKARLTSMIQDIVAQRPGALVLVAKVIRPRALTHRERFARWNTMVAEVVAATNNPTKRFEVRVVDMYTDWPVWTFGNNLTPAQQRANAEFSRLTMYRPPRFTDGVHPSLEGSTWLANRWLNAMQQAQVCP